jgi:alkaline phosphatase
MYFEKYDIMFVMIQRLLSPKKLCFPVIFMFIMGCAPAELTHNETRQLVPDNIILLIADGMAEPQITATRYAHGQLHMDRMPYKGTVTTHSTRKVTDSAAGATALATGHKTDNGMIAQLPDGSNIETIAQYASSIGKRTGLLASCRIVHATPASFAVHHDSRRDEFIIAEKFVSSGINLLLGAGFTHFLPEDEGGSRPDGKNLIEQMRQMGYIYVDNEDQVDEIIQADKGIAFLEATNLHRYPERGDQMIRLTNAALQNLKNSPNGFFLMIEGSQIDWAGHDNDPEWMIQEMIDFDNVVGEVLDFAELHGNTLVIVTSDHETGGLTLLRGETNDDLTYSFSSDYHSAVSVPVLSFGPASERFSGMYDNTDIAKMMFELWGKNIDEEIIQ